MPSFLFLFNSTCNKLAQYIGPTFTKANYCPLVIRNEIDCYDESSTPLFTEEHFGSNSKCVSIKEDGKQLTSLCLKSECNYANHTFDILIGKRNQFVFHCKKNLEYHVFQIHNKSFTVECPRLPAVCPDMFCPAMCSGKGKCNWSLDRPKCECFNPLDETDGCYDSLPLSPEICVEQSSRDSSTKNHPVMFFVSISMGIWVMTTLYLIVF